MTVDLLEDIIQKQQEEIEKKDKIIDLMAIYIANSDVDEDICRHNKESLCKGESEVSLGICYQCIKQYFKNKVEEERE